VTDKNIDIFCSLRFGEGMKYAKQVRDALRKQKNLNAVIVEVPEGNDIASVVAEMIDAAKLVLIFGTQTYGVGTVSFSTKEELQFVMDDKKPFYLIKMCDKFSEARTRLMLHKGISYKYWNIKNDDPMPEDLIDQIVAKYQSVVLGTDSGP
jgi:cobalamin-dependent methionine synthase I